MGALPPPGGPLAELPQCIVMLQPTLAFHSGRGWWRINIWKSGIALEVVSQLQAREECKRTLLSTTTSSSYLGPLACPADWFLNGPSCYKVKNNPKSWTSSQQDCTASGGYLVKIDDGDEQRFMVLFMSIAVQTAISVRRNHVVSVQ